jgi:hypothetical protein
MKITLFLFLTLIFTSCNIIRLLQLKDSNNESTIEVNRYLKHHKYDYSLFADDTKSWMQKTKTYGINNDTSKYSYIQLRIFNRDGSLHSAYSQCMGDFNSRNFVDSFPLKKNDYPFVNTQLKFKNELDLLLLNSETKEQILVKSEKYNYTYVVYYTIWTSYFSKHVLKEVSKIKKKHPNEALVILVNMARDTE